MLASSPTPHRTLLADRALDVRRRDGVAARGQGVLVVVEHPDVPAPLGRLRQPLIASTKAAMGPLPSPDRLVSSPSTKTSTVSWSFSPAALRRVDGVEPQRGARGRGTRCGTSPRSASGATSPPSASVRCWMTRLNSICARRGRSSLCSCLEDVGHAALAGLAVDPDDRLVGAADVLGVDGQVGHRPRVVVDGYAGGRSASRSRASKPFLMASWWEPEKAV